MLEPSDEPSERMLLHLVGLLALSCAACGAGATGVRSPEPAGAASPVDGAPGVWLDRASFAPGETIAVHFNAPSGLPADAWIGLVRAGVPHGDEAINDANDVAYLTLQGQAAGTLEFTAPVERGRWDFRMNSSDAGGRELAFTSFTVAGDQPSGPPRVWLDANVFAPGAPMEIHFTAPAGFSTDAWIGLVPSLVAHGAEAVGDEVDVAYEYLRGRTSGTVTLAAPDRPGPWDVRMFDTDAGGREAASITFQVR